MPSTRVTDPSTSFQAAASVENVTKTQSAILLILEFAKTDDELIDSYYSLASVGGAPNASPSGIRSRRKELVNRELVIDSGERKKLSSGRSAIVWVKA
jgi:hypothetical protein